MAAQQAYLNSVGEHCSYENAGTLCYLLKDSRRHHCRNLALLGWPAGPPDFDRTKSLKEQNWL
jgi:hypothetical protein